MNRHLLPNEIDLLVEGDAGFGAPALRAHLEGCDACRERFEDELFVVQLLEELPHAVPDAAFADRIMAEVPAFVPLHVAAHDTLARWLPRTPAARLAGAVAIALMGALVSAALLWLASRADAAVFATQFVSDRLRNAAVSGAGRLAAAIFGDALVAVLRTSGAVGTVLLVAGFPLAALGTVAALRRLAAARRS